MNFSVLSLYPPGEKSICIALPTREKKLKLVQNSGVVSEKMELLNQITIVLSSNSGICA